MENQRILLVVGKKGMCHTQIMDWNFHRLISYDTLDK